MSAAVHGLTPEVLAKITGTLARFPAIRSAVVFGSRAKGSHRLGSDIDLALTGEDLDWRIVGRLENAFDDLLLPYQFSIVRYDQNLDPEVAAHIARVGLRIYSREQPKQKA